MKINLLTFPFLFIVIRMFVTIVLAVILLLILFPLALNVAAASLFGIVCFDITILLRW